MDISVLSVLLDSKANVPENFILFYKTTVTCLIDLYFTVEYSFIFSSSVTLVHIQSKL